MLCSTSFFALCLLVLGPPLVTASTTSKPNVVFILIDDTGYNDLGYNNRSEGGNSIDLAHGPGMAVLGRFLGYSMKKSTVQAGQIARP